MKLEIGSIIKTNDIVVDDISYVKETSETDNVKESFEENIISKPDETYALSDDNTLAELNLVNGTLSPIFSPNIHTHTF